MKLDKKWIKVQKKFLRKNVRYFYHFPVFSMVEFNLHAKCNRQCPFCPVADPEFYKQAYGNVLEKQLHPTIYKKVLQDMRCVNFQGMVCFSGFSEPLLYPDLKSLVAMTKRILPNSILSINTNGDFMSTSRLNSLFANGLDLMNINLYDNEMQLRHFESMIANSEVDDSQVVIRPHYYNGEDYGLNLSNRTGLVDVSEFGKENEELPAKRICYYPFYAIKVDFNGDVILCPHEWIKDPILGNIKHESLWKIWTGAKIEEIRRTLANNSRDIKPCCYCNVQGDLMGKEYYEAWRKRRTA